MSATQPEVTSLEASQEAWEKFLLSPWPRYFAREVAAARKFELGEEAAFKNIESWLTVCDATDHAILEQTGMIEKLPPAMVDYEDFRASRLNEAGRNVVMACAEVEELLADEKAP